MTTPAESFRPRNEAYGSDAFRLEYSPDTPPEAITKDLESFLGEYVFQLPIYDYELAYVNGQILDPNTRESMTSKSLKAIRLRQSEGKNIDREESEFYGFMRLEDQLQIKGNNSVVVWISPPGPREDGYGDYGFIYLGQLIDEETLQMEALRVERPRISDFSRLYNTLHPDIFFNPMSDTEFIANPLILTDTDMGEVEDLVDDLFKRKSPLLNPAFDPIIQRLSPYIDKYLEVVQTGGSKEFEQQVFNMLVNYSIELKWAYDDKGHTTVVSLPFLRALEQYGYSAPRLQGSCGSTGSSNDLFNAVSPLSKVLNSESKKHWDYHNGDCVVCNSRNTEVGPCNICKSCEKKFD